MNNLGKNIRKEFNIFNENNNLAYLDTAATSLKPNIMVNNMADFLQNHYGTVHRGAYKLSVLASTMYEQTRNKVAKFVGANISPEQVVFTKGATESLNFLAYGIGEMCIDDNSRIITTVAEHHANLIPWQQLALKKNAEIAYILLQGQTNDKLKLNLDTANKMITKNTKVVSLAYVGNVLGQTNEIAKICEIAKKIGAYVVVDCAQSISTHDDNLFDLGVDAIAFAAHKMYGPTGLGIMVGTKELLTKMPPMIYGGAMISEVSLEASEWADYPAKFEAGTPPIAEVIALNTTIDWINNIGRKNIFKHITNLATMFAEGLKQIDGIQIYSPLSDNETLISFRHKSMHAHDLATILDNYNVAVRAGHHCAWPLIKFLEVDALLRASFGVYSDIDHVEQALEAIKKAISLFK